MTPPSDPQKDPPGTRGHHRTRARARTPLVSAVVLFHDDRTADDAIPCIEALRKQKIAGELEIIVVDGRSGNTPSLRRFEKQPDEGAISVIRTRENLGYGRGNNRGAATAKGEFLLIINPDCRLEPDAIAEMVRFLRAESDVGIVGPQLVFPDGTIRDSFRTFPTPLDLVIKRTPMRFLHRKRMTRYLQWDRDPNQTRSVDWLCGACLLLRRTFFEELGGFDPRFFLFFEDCDLCRRCWERGKRVVYYPEAKARDSRHRLSSGGAFSFLWKKTVRAHIASAVKYFWKWRGERARDQVRDRDLTELYKPSCDSLKDST